MQDSKDLKEETGAAPHECLHHSLVRVKSDIDSADAACSSTDARRATRYLPLPRPSREAAGETRSSTGSCRAGRRLRIALQGSHGQPSAVADDHLASFTNYAPHRKGR